MLSYQIGSSLQWMWNTVISDNPRMEFHREQLHVCNPLVQQNPWTPETKAMALTKRISDMQHV